MADFEEASAAAVQSVFDDVAISGCWFHFAQAVIKRVNKTGLKDASINDAHVTDIVHCLDSTVARTTHYSSCVL